MVQIFAVEDIFEDFDNFTILAECADSCSMVVEVT